MCSTFKSTSFTSNNVEKIVGSQETMHKEKTRKLGYNVKGNSARMKRILEAEEIDDNNNFVKGLAWIMHVDSNKFPKKKKPIIVKRLYNMVSNKDAVAPTIIRYYIGGNVKKTNVRIIDKFWITANCNQILRKNKLTL